jgi:glycosyltransferase involved in cell wall biosynthesis
VRRLVVYIWRPEFAYALDALPEATSCYHLDDEYTFLYTMSDVDQPVPAAEQALLRRVDQVFPHSPGLMEKKGGYNRHSMALPNGVDYQAFATPADEPDDLRSIPRPRIGYVGVVKDELDIPLLLALARERADRSWVFVGPTGYFQHYGSEFRELLALPNVFSLGRKDVTDLPGYVQHMDVCLLPYVENDYTRYIYPMKLHEYLATGRPVVAKPIRSLQDFAEELYLARTAAEWGSALERALSEPPASALPERRREVARQHDWDVLVRRIADTIMERMGEARPS